MRNSNCFLHCICLFPLFVQRCLFFLLNQVTKREEIKTKEIQLVQTFFFFGCASITWEVMFVFFSTMVARKKLSCQLC